jgi:hypothetical protein
MNAPFQIGRNANAAIIVHVLDSPGSQAGTRKSKKGRRDALEMKKPPSSAAADRRPSRRALSPREMITEGDQNRLW